MEREQILRDDFQTVRKGWDPDEVRDHLRAVANGAKPEAEAPLADAAAERVRSVIAAAEEVAAEIRAETRAEADGLLASARAESERIVERAREVANERVEQARAAVEGLVSQADELRNRVGTLGEELTGNIRSSGAVPSAEVPGPIIVPEPSPPTIPEPTPDPVPEPTPDPTPDPPMPDPVPEPTPDPVPDPTPDPGIDPQPPVPDPGPEPPQPAAASKSASTEDLIAQLKGGASTAPVNGSGEPSAPGSDLAAARLVAMNMALEGCSREQISARISSEFGGLDDLDGMLDDVLARAGR